jgi:hypothetical protein
VYCCNIVLIKYVFSGLPREGGGEISPGLQLKGPPKFAKRGPNYPATDIYAHGRWKMRDWRTPLNCWDPSENCRNLRRNLRGEAWEKVLRKSGKVLRKQLSNVIVRKIFLPKKLTTGAQCCCPENFFVGKVLPLPPPPKHGPHGATANTSFFPLLLKIGDLSKINL